MLPWQSGSSGLKNIQDGGEAILEALRSLNVEYVISSPGSEWPSFWEALARQKKSGTPGPTYLDCGHETLAVAMATGYTQVTGRMQAVLASRGRRPPARQHGDLRRADHGNTHAGDVRGIDRLWRGRIRPRPQWYRSLNVVGGPQRLVDPLVKAALQSTSVATRSTTACSRRRARPAPAARTDLPLRIDGIDDRGVVEAGAMRTVAPPPAARPADDDIAKVAAELAKARSPVHPGRERRLGPGDRSTHLSSSRSFSPSR